MLSRLPFLLVASLLLAGCAEAGASSPAVRPHSPPGRNLAGLVERPLPSRDLYQLADQLRLRPPRRIAHVVRNFSPNYLVGHRDEFRVLSEDKLSYFVLHATIRAETPHLYIYVQNGLKVDENAVRTAAQTFEHKTYPTDHAFFGSEWNPGVDGDPHITCLIGNLESSSAAGFYSAEDEYPRLVNPYSNAREMFYINTNTLPGDGAFDVTLAHEFQHMIHWHMHPRDNAWLNEGMSMVAQRVNGYPNSVSGEVQAFLGDSQTQLDTWGTGDNSNHYGASYLFLIYLYDRFGRGFLHEMVADRAYTDLELVNDVLRKRLIPETADQVFGDWVVANYLDNPAPSQGKYFYNDLPSTVAPARTFQTVPFVYHGTLAPYATSYVALPTSGVKPFHLEFSAASTVALVGLPGSSSFWWSNRGDLIDTRLVRTVDLTRVRQARLHFQVWYEIENTYDYGFVEASTDNGSTWSTLPGTHTQNSNPTGANYGNGYTGTSKGWLNETVNLSRYAGKRIELRFEYVTDDEVNLQGMALRGLYIPEIGFRDNFTGWSARGFLPVTHNVLPSNWTVKLIEYRAKGVRVTHLALSAAKAGSIAINPAALHLQKLVVAIFTTAPKTTVKTSFELVARSS